MNHIHVPEARPTTRYTPFPYTTLFRSRRRTPAISFLGTATMVPSGVRATARSLLDCATTTPVTAVEQRSRDRKSTPSELQSRRDLVCRLLLEKKNINHILHDHHCNNKH